MQFKPLTFWNLDEETEAQKGEVTWPGSWDKVVAELGLEGRSPAFLGSELFPLHLGFVRPEPGSPLGLKQSNLARLTSGL